MRRYRSFFWPPLLSSSTLYFLGYFVVRRFRVVRQSKRTCARADRPPFLSSLCVVPALHFLCATWNTERLRWQEMVLLGLQGIILGLALQQRTTVYWVVAAALILATLQWVFCAGVCLSNRKNAAF